jgi:predicted Kef-type K+ transport protein
MDFAFDTAFYEIAVLVLLAAAVGVVGLLARQPLIVAFIFVGVLAGPDALGIASSEDLHRDAEPDRHRGAAVPRRAEARPDAGAQPRARGGGDGARAGGFHGLLRLPDLPRARDRLADTSLYIAVALTFSSTIIIVKLLSDKREIGALHGKIALGFLIVQDIFVVLAMVVAVGGGRRDRRKARAERRGEIARSSRGSIVLGFVAVFAILGADAARARSWRARPSCW